MHSTPREVDKLLIATAADSARYACGSKTTPEWAHCTATNISVCVSIQIWQKLPSEQRPARTIRKVAHRRLALPRCELFFAVILLRQAKACPSQSYQHRPWFKFPRQQGGCDRKRREYRQRREHQRYRRAPKKRYRSH